MNKRVVFFWFFALAIEIAVGYFIYSKFIQFKKQKFEKEALTKVAVIDETKVEKNVDPELKYYWEFKPNDQPTDKPYWLDEAVVYNINADGLNDVSDYPLEKELDTFRIVTLGDSFTYGQYVDTYKNWTELLEKKLNESAFTCQINKIEVINLGMPGFDVQEIVRRYKRIGHKYNPDLILYFESGSGFERFNEIAMPMVQECIGHQSAEETSTSSAQNLLRESVKADFLKIRGCWNSAADKVAKDLSLFKRKEMLESHLQELFTLAENHQVWFFYQKDLATNYSEIVKDWIIKYPDNKFFLTLPAPIFGKNVFIDWHPNQFGHQEIAETIYNTLVDKQAVCLAK